MKFTYRGEQNVTSLCGHQLKPQGGLIRGAQSMRLECLGPACTLFLIAVFLSPVPPFSLPTALVVLDDRNEAQGNPSDISLSSHSATYKASLTQAQAIRTVDKGAS